ncbi:Vanillate O-demethylase monooxygenase subunit OS=Castellaniella defragrans OX=75697 GN=HNR28_001896 PE=4 SV=1 [Castellaniella defragrans]
MFVKNVWYVAGFEQDFEAPFVARKILGEPVILYRSSDGAYVALKDECPHRLVPLSLGARVGDCIQCGYHGMCFSGSGACVSIPGQDRIPEAAHVATYPVVQRHGIVWIWMGDRTLADAALIPDLHWNASTEWAASRGYHHFDCHYALMNDNLLDLSHETYVHKSTIGNREEEPIAHFTPRVTTTGDSVVRAHREMRGIAAPPFFALMIGRDCVINRWQSAIHLVPSTNLTVVGIHPVEDDRATARIVHVLHLLTPETESSTHYFWAVVRNFRVDDEALTESLRVGNARTFDEDKAIVEAQQRRIAQTGTSVPRVALALDQAPIRARRMLEKRLKHEQEDPRYTEAPPALVPEHSFAVLEEAAA